MFLVSPSVPSCCPSPGDCVYVGHGLRTHLGQSLSVSIFPMLPDLPACGVGGKCRGLAVLDSKAISIHLRDVMRLRHRLHGFAYAPVLRISVTAAVPHGITEVVLSSFRLVLCAVLFSCVVPLPSPLGFFVVGCCCRRRRRTPRFML